MHAMTGTPSVVLDHLEQLLDEPRSHGRPWNLSLRRRLEVVALRTNLTVRQLADIFAISKSQAHRIISNLVPKISALFDRVAPRDRRFSWAVDGTLIPTRDHTTAAKARNRRWSANAQVLARTADLQIVAITGGGPGNRNDPYHYLGSVVEDLCRRHGRVLADGGYRSIRHLVGPVFEGRSIRRDADWRTHRLRRARVEHAIARLKDWQVLRDHRRRGAHAQDTARAVAALHNLRIQLRDSS
jgi:hypothetical protein